MPHSLRHRDLIGAPPAWWTQHLLVDERLQRRPTVRRAEPRLEHRPVLLRHVLRASARTGEQASELDLGRIQPHDLSQLEEAEL
eukprot:607709-Prymnesium_polylepis.2